MNFENAKKLVLLELYDVELWCDYIYLDTDERRRFAQVSHEYLIEQLQFSQGESKTKIDLNLNHPVKELIWVGTSGTANATDTRSSDPVTYVTTGTALLKLNGHDRFAKRDAKYLPMYKDTNIILVTVQLL